MIDLIDSLLSFLRNLDWGGVLSLVIVVILMQRFKVYTDIYGKAKKAEPLWGLVIVTIGLIGSVALWLSVRSILLYTLHYLQNGWVYVTDEIFTMLSFILTANLCFTLVRAFAKIGEKKETEKGQLPEKELEEIAEKRPLPEKELTDIGIQAVIITLLTFLPFYRTNDPSQFLNVAFRYASISITLIVVLAALIIVRSRLIKSSK